MHLFPISVYDFSPWGEWGECSGTCGPTATQTRSRTCNDTAYDKANVEHSKCLESYSVGKAPSDLAHKLFHQQKRCENVAQHCPRDGNYTEWEPWGPCGPKCGHDIQTSLRFCVNPSPAFGGKNCTGHNMRQKTCISDTPCPVHCITSVWGQWSTCAQSCVDSDDISMTTRYRQRNIIQHPEDGGIPCPKSLVETKTCTSCNSSESPEEGCVPRCPSRHFIEEVCIRNVSI